MRRRRDAPRAATWTITSCVAQPTPFLQRFCLLRFICGEHTGGLDGAMFLARKLESLGPLDVNEATCIADGWRKS